MKTLKKILCLCVTFSFLFLNTSIANANEGNSNTDNILLGRYQVNEFEQYKSTMNLRNRLDSNPYEEFDKGVLNYQKFSEVELLNMGFSEMQINAIKNFDFTDTARYYASPTLTTELWSTTSYYIQEENKTYISLRSYYTWSSPVMTEAFDTVMIGVHGLDSNYTRLDATVEYEYTNTDGIKKKTGVYDRLQIGYDGLGVSYYQLPTQIFLNYDDITGRINTNNLNYVSLYSSFVAPGKHVINECLSAYSRTQNAFLPQFSIGINGIDFSFSFEAFERTLSKKYYHLNIPDDYHNQLDPFA